MTAYECKQMIMYLDSKGLNVQGLSLNGIRELYNKIKKGDVKK